MTSAETGPRAKLPASAYDAALALLLAHDRFVLTTHRDPDGDGLGAEAALAAALRQLGKDCCIVNDSALPHQYAFLGQHERFEVYRGRTHQEAVLGSDVMIVLDAAQPERAGRIGPALRAHRGASLTIDHHPAGGWATVSLIDATACATTELVHDLITRMAVELTPHMAGALYTGLVADTQCFRTPNVTPDVHRRAAELLEAGADASRIHDALFGVWPLGRQRLLGEFMASLRSTAGGRIVWGVVERSALRRFRQPTSAIEGFVEEALSVEGADLAVFFLEEADAIRVSFRARNQVTVGGLARDLGGGGHAQAAGSRVPLPLDSAVRRVLGAARQVVAKSPAVTVLGPPGSSERLSDGSARPAEQTASDSNMRNS
jgi:phosphoesterase RecJ-like protein